MTHRVRVLVADDSTTVRMRLCEILSSDRQIEVVGQAADGRRAVELCQHLRPSVVTLDMAMPKLSGAEATEVIMARCPTPILIVSSSTNRGDLFRTYDALAAGALDVMDKPRGDEADGVWERLFLSTVKLVSRVRVVTHLRGRFAHRSLAPLAPMAASPCPMPPSEHWQPGLVAIGASTGGPAALLEILGQLPSDFSLPIVVVVHIAAIFGDGLADWLDNAVPLEVRIAEDRAALGQGGRVWLAPADRHLRVVEGALRLDSGPERHSCRPSVDTLFESVATEFGPQAIGALLTGMGRDGAQGLLVMRRAGGVTIAQDEPSSVVFGMPREAITIGAAREVLPLSLVGPRLVELAPAPWRRRRP